MITHTVFFTLMHPREGKEEASFFLRLSKLQEIEVVRAFNLVREVSPKNGFDYGLLMEFDSEEDLKTYNEHPSHIDFVNSIWIPQVRDFLEIDYIPLEGR